MPCPFTCNSSAEVAARSRLRLPEGYTAKAAPKSPNEIDYEVTVPAEGVATQDVNLTSVTRYGRQGDGAIQSYYNDSMNAEVSYQTAGIGAETSSGGDRRRGGVAVAVGQRAHRQAGSSISWAGSTALRRRWRSPSS